MAAAGLSLLGNWKGPAGVRNLQGVAEHEESVSRVLAMVVWWEDPQDGRQVASDWVHISQSATARSSSPRVQRHRQFRRLSRLISLTISYVGNAPAEAST